MEVIFYKNKSDKKVVSKNIEQKINTNCILKDDTNIKNPTIIISNLTDLKNCNYVYIEEFNRFYYINNITFSQQRYYIECNCDVLMSFRKDILNLKCIIKRQEKKYNLYLNDEKYKAFEYSRIKTIEFPNGFTKQSFCLAIAGGGQ